MWILSLWANPLARKIILYGAATLVIFWCIRLWSNRVWGEGFRQGKTAGAIEMEKAKKAEWDQERKSIEGERVSLSSARSAIGAQTADLARSRKALDASLSRIHTITKTGSNNACAAVMAVPPDLLDAAIRQKSAELSAIIH